MCFDAGDSKPKGRHSRSERPRTREHHARGHSRRHDHEEEHCVPLQSMVVNRQPGIIVHPEHFDYTVESTRLVSRDAHRQGRDTRHQQFAINLGSTRIGTFTVYESRPGELEVGAIYTSRDPRQNRPKASDLFLGIWVVALGRSIAALERISFLDCAEETVMASRDYVYSLMGGAGLLDQPLTIRGPSLCHPDEHSPEEETAFHHLLTQTNFGKSAAHLVNNYAEVVQYGLAIASFTYKPRGGRAFDFRVDLCCPM